MLPEAEDHHGTVATCELKLPAHSNGVYRADFCALPTKDAAIQVVFYPGFLALSHQPYGAGRAGILAKDAEYAFIHIPDGEAPVALRYNRFLCRIFERARLPRKLLECITY
jgi:hypothetical protein